MRTTLDIDADVLGAAKAIAAREKSSTGKVLSALARQALTPRVAGELRNGVPILPARAGARSVTPEVVNRLRDES